jgi:uncharacterized membrane protein
VEAVKNWIEWSATGIEVLAVAIIVFGCLFGTVRFLFTLPGNKPGAYSQYKIHLGKMLLLVLELLVAADIIRTVALEQTLTNVAILAILVLVRTFLSWSLTVEIEGRWPWTARLGGPE